jgi:hypothetical protein
MTDGCTYCGFKHCGQLRRMGNELTIVAALTEQLVRVGFLEISSTDFRTWDLRCDCKNRDARTMSFKQAIDQVQVAWTTAPGTNGEFASQMGFRAGRKSRGLFVPRMNPFDVTTPANRVSYSVEAIAHNTVNSTHPS